MLSLFSSFRLSLLEFKTHNFFLGLRVDACYIFLPGIWLILGRCISKELPSHWLTLGLGTPQCDSCQVRGCTGSKTADIPVMLTCPSPGSDTESEPWALDSSTCLKYEAGDGDVCASDSVWVRNIRKNGIWNQGIREKTCYLHLSHCPSPKIFKARVQIIAA